MSRTISFLSCLCVVASVSAATATMEIRRPAEIPENAFVTYRSADAGTVDKSVDLSRIISVGKGRQAEGRLRTPDEGENYDFQMALDTVAKEAWVIKCTSTEAVVTIPDEIEYEGEVYPVTTLNTQSFAALSSLTELNFGANVRVVKPQTFLVCMKLSTVNLNEGLVEIGDQAFSTFMTGITSIELPSTVEVLGERAFSGTRLTGEFIINKSLRQIGGGCFAGKSITGFYICEEGNDYFESIDGVLYTKDGEALVVYPPALVEPTLVLPDGLKKLAPYSFAYCSTVTKVVLPESLTEIGAFSFRGCNLSEFSIGANVEKIGEGVVVDNRNLTAITLDPANACFTLNDGMLVDNETKTLLAVAYNKTNIEVEPGVNRVSPYLCYNNQNVTLVSTPESVKEIGDYAFYGCKSLSSINLAGVETIGANCFYSVMQTDKVVFPATLKTIGNYAFANCGIAEFELSDGLETLGTGVFQNSSIEKINIPGTTHNLGASLFFGCTKLSDLTLCEGIPYIPETMCYSCEKLYFLDFPSTITEVGNAAFSFSWLQLADLPEGCVKVGSSAFQLAPLHYIDMPNSLEEIGDFGFSLTNAEYIKCGTGLKRIGQNGLQASKKATSILLNEGLESIGYRALYGEELISEITIPSTVTHVGDSAFILTPLSRLVNLSPTPQPLTTAITGYPYNPFPHVDPIYDTCTLVVPEGSGEAYREADIWGLFINIEEIPTVGIKGVEDEEGVTIVKIYGIDGVRRDDLGKGLNICVMSDGTIRKQVK